MRVAFVMASNGPRSFGSIRPLTFALDDADRLRSQLQSAHCGFDVTSPKRGSKPRDVVYELERLCETCGPDDTMVCFFSGHGILDNKGNLVLLWDHSNPDELMTSAIGVAKIMAALDGCRAKNRLLLLDCCHAGAVVHMSGLKGAGETPLSAAVVPPDNYAVLMASGRLERARELEKYKGSFFTDGICSALSEDFSRADQDGDGRLSLGDVTAWLQERARSHNVMHPEDQVPYPSAFGKYRGDFYLTIGIEDWLPYEVPWPDGSTMVVLPVRDRHYLSHAVCISKHPVTNAQFRRFVNTGDAADDKYANPRFDVEHYEFDDFPTIRVSPPGERRRTSRVRWLADSREPRGEDFKHSTTAGNRGRWKGPFLPWGDERFRGDDQPVVCVDLRRADAYAQWVTKTFGFKTAIPSVRTWDFAAFGAAFPARDPRIWLQQGSVIHHMCDRPAPIDRSGARTNRRGVSDMIGNVWEWCYIESGRHSAFLGPPPARGALRGGSFLDDMRQVEPFIDVDVLPERHRTSHSDLGFRLSAIVPLERLPESVQTRLGTCETVDRLLDNTSFD